MSEDNRERIGFSLGGGQSDNQNDDDTPGTLDRLARFEEVLHGDEFRATTNEIASQIRLVGEIVQQAKTSIDSIEGPDTFARRVQVLRQVALRLEEPAAQLSTLASNFGALMDDIDEGFNVIVDQAPAEIAADPETREVFVATFNGMRVLSEHSREAYRSTQMMIDSMVPLMKTSRVVRPVLRRLRQSLTVMVDNFQLADNWTHLIEASGIDC